MQRDPGDTLHDRRNLLKLLLATGGVAALNPLEVLAQASKAAAPAGAGTGAATFHLANPSYEPVYSQMSGYYFNDPAWVKETTPRLTWPKEGDKVPELTVMIPSHQTDWLDGWRKWAKDAEAVGIKYNIQQLSHARWLNEINGHRHGDIECHPSVLRPERVDPAEWLVSRAYGRDRRNYGEWVNEQYDELIDRQTIEADPAKRLQYVREAQSVLAEDLYCMQFGWGPAIIEAYNAARWEEFVKTTGFGIANFNAHHGFLKARPKDGNPNVLKVGMVSLLETTNILAASNNMRSIGRLVYDRLAYFDENLNTIPWAVESWNRIDERTWDIKLRPGMKFHDGQPVTAEDLKFTFDFLMKYERGIFWTANQFLESVEIVDAGNGVLRTRFKEPYGQFESYFLQLNVILPRHIWQNIMAEQGVGDNPRQLRIDKPIGSGPYRMGRHRKDTELQLVAIKDHFCKPGPDEIIAVVAPSLDGLMGRLEGEDIDVIESSSVSLSPSQAEQLSRQSHVKVERTKDVNWYHGVVRASWLPWRDIEFRRAWMHTIDREFLINVPWEGAGRVPTANTFLVEGNPWHNPDLPAPPAFDLDKAREVLRAAGYTWAADGRLVFPPPTDEAWRKRVNDVSKPGYTWGGLKMLG
ncbi:hypothetical protein FOZ76_00685 [Verticiella sediminum]|uniref:Solute-binding protein family 5 domain-containing protein n=1 Tax=Verticiella sediminum TaxID=1247510 RepID=A0A556B260_9BURK|nr:ABC transporter substrate-binding protein [Verticiella sediminum]TSH99276.1 hypothetical protein FOZ76_00685 [Verticiella sediminum]